MAPKHSQDHRGGVVDPRLLPSDAELARVHEDLDWLIAIASLRDARCSKRGADVVPLRPSVAVAGDRLRGEAEKGADGDGAKREHHEGEPVG